MYIPLPVLSRGNDTLIVLRWVCTLFRISTGAHVLFWNFQCDSNYFPSHFWCIRRIKKV